MKKFLVSLVLLATLAMTAGCRPLPRNMEAALTTAQITLQVTVDDVEAAKPPFAPVDGETEAEKIARLEKQSRILTETMKQANKNLKTVVAFVRNDVTIGDDSE